MKTTTDAKTQKASLRKSFETLRKSAHDADPDPLSAPGLVQKLLHQAVTMGDGVINNISMFWPYRTEIDTRPLMAHAESQGFRVCLPVTTIAGEPLHFRPYKLGDALIEDHYGIPVPAHTGEEVEPTLLFVPMFAFDRCGYRLGYGGGYYDMTLAKYRDMSGCKAIGLAYEVQLCEESLAFEDTDMALDAVFTEVACWKAHKGHLVRTPWSDL